MDSNQIDEMELNGIDVENALRRMAGNKKLFIEILGSFYTDYINFENDLNEAIANGNSECYLKMIHTLKGIAGNIGATDLFVGMQELETELKNEISASKLNDIIKEKLSLLKVVLNSISKNGLAKQLTKEDIMTKLYELQNMLASYDYEATDKLKEIGTIEGFETQFEELDKKINDSSFEKASEMLQEILLQMSL